MRFPVIFLYLPPFFKPSQESREGIKKEKQVLIFELSCFECYFLSESNENII